MKCAPCEQLLAEYSWWLRRHGQLLAAEVYRVAPFVASTVAPPEDAKVTKGARTYLLPPWIATLALVETPDWLRWRKDHYEFQAQVTALSLDQDSNARTVWKKPDIGYIARFRLCASTQPFSVVPRSPQPLFRDFWHFHIPLEFLQGAVAVTLLTSSPTVSGEKNDGLWRCIGYSRDLKALILSYLGMPDTRSRLRSFRKRLRGSTVSDIGAVGQLNTRLSRCQQVETLELCESFQVLDAQPICAFDTLRSSLDKHVRRVTAILHV